MAALTDRIALTSSAYRDVSAGAANCAFVVWFDPQNRSAVRVILGTSLPSPEATNYDLIDPANVRVGADIKSESIMMRFNRLQSTDRVYVRADSQSLGITVYTI